MDVKTADATYHHATSEPRFVRRGDPRNNHGRLHYLCSNYRLTRIVLMPEEEVGRPAR